MLPLIPTSSNCLFCLTNRPKPQDSSFTIMIWHRQFIFFWSTNGWIESLQDLRVVHAYKLAQRWGNGCNIASATLNSNSNLGANKSLNRIRKSFCLQETYISKPFSSCVWTGRGFINSGSFIVSRWMSNELRSKVHVSGCFMHHPPKAPHRLMQKLWVVRVIKSTCMVEERN